jgi:hypothetical protein
MRHRLRIHAAAAFLAASAVATAVPDAMTRDQILEIANEGYRLHWYCSASSIYTGVTNAKCPYSTPGWQDGISYKWGGYDTRDSFWQAVVVNGGWAGDTNSAATVSGTYGDDCSGYLSRTWRSGRYSTSNLSSVSTQGTYALIAPGDAMNDAGSHVRLFEKYTGTNLIQLFECTTGVSPGRVTRRVLSTNTTYLPMRYNYVQAWPAIVRATASGASSAVIEFLGAASTGFRLYRSTDAANWTLVADESALGVQAQSHTATGLADGTTYYFRVAPVNGGVEGVPSLVFPVRIKAGARKALVVHGFDRWTRKATAPATNAPHAFLVRYAEALANAGYAFDTADNLRVIDQTMALGGYGSVWWMLGDESTTDEAFSYQEQLRVQDYLAAGGKLFVSGSEILWDLVSKQAFPNDTPFAQNYLKAGFSSDGSAGNGYAFSGIAGTVCSGTAGAFDNGTGGTYAPTYPDILTASGGSQAVLQYATGGNAAVCYQGTFGSGSVPGAVFVMGFPFETITTPAARNAVVNAATTALFGAAGVGDWNSYGD